MRNGGISKQERCYITIYMTRPEREAVRLAADGDCRHLSDWARQTLLQAAHLHERSESAGA